MATTRMREAIREYKRRLGCHICGERTSTRRLVLVRPDGSGLSLSRMIDMSSVSEETLWREISRRVVVCRGCSQRAGPHARKRGRRREGVAWDASRE